MITQSVAEFSQSMNSHREERFSATRRSPRPHSPQVRCHPTDTCHPEGHWDGVAGGARESAGFAHRPDVLRG